MLVHGTVARGSKGFVILLLLLVTAAISVQTFHFHSPTESTSVRCTLCEVAPGILPVLTITAFLLDRLVQGIEVEELATDLRSPEGSNLSVRPPPSALN